MSMRQIIQTDTDSKEDPGATLIPKTLSVERHLPTFSNSNLHLHPQLLPPSLIMSSSDTTEYQLYHYEPSLPAGATFCALFLLSMFLHIYQTTLTRSRSTIPLIIGCLCEALGYIGRILNARETPASRADYSLGPYIMQALLLLIAPLLIAATVYMTLGYVVLATDGEKHAMIKERFLTKLFVIGDIFAFLVQSTGGGLLAKGEPDSKQAGNWIVIGGLGIQILFFGMFMVVAAMFGIRMHARPTERSQLPQVRWRLHLGVLFVASLLIMIRSVFRVVEYVQGTDGYLLSHEVFLYVFDALPMIVAVVLFNIWHPTDITAIVKGGKRMHKVVLTAPVERLVPDPKTARADEEIALRESGVTAHFP